MRAIIVMFDSLSRKYLQPYGNDWVQTPNFTRLANRSVTFDKCYVGSMPCIPARRELHTGRPNFLHRSWGPVEPFDDSMPEILDKNGIYTHLTTDHYHYWEDGGATYHQRYSSFDFIRGQEGDKWIAEVADPEIPEHLGSGLRQDWINRKYTNTPATAIQTRTFDLGLEFLQRNKYENNWMLQIECFDPHPPFFATEDFRKLYEHEYDGPHFDWPRYGPINEKESPEAVAHLQKEYAAIVSQCDASLGRVLDEMDAQNLWDDTMLIVTTDHGFLLGEHNGWAFVWPPFYDEIAVKPLFVWDPRSKRAGERSDSLVQTLDIPATLLEYFGQELPLDMQGKPLKEAVANNAQLREAVLFGVFGGHVNVSDGRYVYMRAPIAEANAPLYEYTLLPTHMKHPFSVEELQTLELAPPFSFTKGCPVNRIEGKGFMNKAYEFGTLLFDLETDPQQQNPLQDEAIEARMIELLLKLMQENDAPHEQYQRLGLPIPTQ
jgi:arylsulfatase A-like enzyme